MTKSYILIADDDAEDLHLIKNALRQHHPEIGIHTVGDGREVLRYLEGLKENQLPTFILLDYKMPFLNGEEVLTVVSQRPEWCPIPKMVWSTSAEPADIERCKSVGALDYLCKPCSSAELREVVIKISKYFNS